LPERKQAQTIKESLIKIRDALLDLKVIFVKLDDEDDAYIIFETLNTRGKDLSLTDLVKNHVTKHLKSQSASVDQTKVKWERILETIEGSPLDLRTDSFIHHFWLSRYDYLPSKNLFKTLRKKIYKDNAKQFLDDLVADSAIYRYIHEVDYRKWGNHERRIRDALTALQLFRVTQQVPCVLSLMRGYSQGKLKRNHLEDALVAIEKFHFLFTAVTSQRSSAGFPECTPDLAGVCPKRKIWIRRSELSPNSRQCSERECLHSTNSKPCLQRYCILIALRRPEG
jgi:hypothetical protein